MKIELAKCIFQTTLTIMKSQLDLGEYKLDEKSFKYYKKETMDFAYNGLKKLFQTLEKEKIIERCEKKCNLRKGYSDCLCGGSGYKNRI